MKKLLVLLFLLSLLLACQVPIEEITVVENIYYENEVKKFVNQQIFPDPNRSRALSPATPSDDFDDGIFYKENSKSIDGLTHEIDLSTLTGGSQALVYIEVEVIDHGFNHDLGIYDDEAGAIYFKERNSQALWKEVRPRFNMYTEDLLVLTDETGFIHFYHDHNFDYWSNPTCDPGHEIYKWEKITITAKWLVVGITIK